MRIFHQTLQSLNLCLEMSMIYFYQFLMKISQWIDFFKLLHKDYKKYPLKFLHISTHIYFPLKLYSFGHCIITVHLNLRSHSFLKSYIYAEFQQQQKILKQWKKKSSKIIQLLVPLFYPLRHLFSVKIFE